LEKSGSSTAYAAIRDRLRADIFSGALEPDSKLTVAALSRRYGVGAMPIRAALQELRGQGLVIGEPRRGARVRRVDAEFVSNIYELRIAILGILYPRCVRLIANRDIEELEAIQRKLDEATRRGDFPSVRRYNIEFHRTIYRIADNPEATDVIERNWGFIDSLRARFGFGEGRMDDANQSHHGIIEALRRRDAKTAVELATRSAERSRLDMIGLVTKAAEERAARANANRRADPAVREGTARGAGAALD
jgi:DNA-binding GntR family transcriptional regulator